MITPSLELEQRLLRSTPYVAGIDEVGRGALAGPLVVGVAIIGRGHAPFPAGLADSKLLKPAQREALTGPVQDWVTQSACGWVQAPEIDTLGVTAALRLGAWRALAQLTCKPGAIILDGNYDWVSPPVPTLFDTDACEGWARGISVPDLGELPPVFTRVKADATCGIVAAASVIAKVARDRFMAEAGPGYGWERNAGYGSAQHRAAIAKLGLSAQHRRSFCTRITSGEELTGE